MQEYQRHSYIQVFTHTQATRYTHKYALIVIFFTYIPTKRVDTLHKVTTKYTLPIVDFPHIGNGSAACIGINDFPPQLHHHRIYTKLNFWLTTLHTRTWNAFTQCSLHLPRRLPGMGLSLGSRTDSPCPSSCT